jgi:hypothetical protein
VRDLRPVYLPLDPASRTTWFRRPHRAADLAGVSARKPQLGGHGLVDLRTAQLRVRRNDFWGSPAERAGHMDRIAPGVHRRATADQRQGGWRPWRAARAQSGNAPLLPPALGPISRRQTGGAFPAPRLLRVSARRFRRGSAARRTGEDGAGSRGREHDRHRCDLSRCRPPAPRAQLNDWSVSATTERLTEKTPHLADNPDSGLASDPVARWLNSRAIVCGSGFFRRRFRRMSGPVF